MNPTDWQPIETAPKDGTRVLARCNDSRWPCVVFFGVGGWYSSPGDYSRKPTHWFPLSNSEPERTSDEPCAPTTTDTPTPSSLSASSATGSERSTRTESVATVGGTMKGNARDHYLKTWPVFFAKIKAGEKPFEIRQNDRSFNVGDILVLEEWSPETKQYTGARLHATVTCITEWEQKPGFVVMGMTVWESDLRRDLLAARAEVEQLKSQLTSIIPNSAPASPAWLAKATQREDALTIAELRKKVERLTKERDESREAACVTREELREELATLRQQLAEAQSDWVAITASYRKLCDLMGKGDSPNPEHRAQWLVNRVALRESQIDALYDRNCDAAKVGGIDFTGDDTPTRLAELVADFRSQLSAATARAEELESKNADLLTENDTVRGHRKELASTLEYFRTILSGGAGEICHERQRQITAEGWTLEHDDMHGDSSLASAAAAYLEYYINPITREACGPRPAAWIKGACPPKNWPWERRWWKPSNDLARMLVKAGALIAAEIDRLQRKPFPPSTP